MDVSVYVRYDNIIINSTKHQYIIIQYALKIRS